MPEPAQSRSIRAPRQVDKKQDGGDELERRSVREREEGRGGLGRLCIHTHSENILSCIHQNATNLSYSDAQQVHTCVLKVSQ